MCLDISPPWSISGLAYQGVQTAWNNATGCRFGDNGNYLFVGVDNGYILRYPLATPYDVATLQAYDNFTTNPIVSDWARAVDFNSDGTRLYVGQDRAPNLQQFDLSVAWDLSTAGAGAAAPNMSDDISGVSFSPDGRYMFIAEMAGTDQVRRHELLTPWDVSTAQAADQWLTYNGIRGVRMHPSGLQMLVTGESDDKVHLYDFSIPWDLSSATLADSQSLKAWTGNPMDLDISPDGKHLVTVSYSGNEINYFAL
jgi:WD40 repeat protein